MVACFNAGHFARTAALFTDDYWRREIDGSPGKAEGLSDDARATPRPRPADQQLSPLKVIEVKVLADGRLAALVSFGAATRTDSNVDLVAFAQVDGQWLIDEVATDYGDDAATPKTG